MTPSGVANTIRYGKFAKDDLVATLFAPLMNGSVVVLRVEDPKLPKKKRVRDPLLFIQRMGDSGAILLSMPGYGCELLHPGKPIVAMDVYRIGIRMRLAAQLAKALNAVLTER